MTDFVYHYRRRHLSGKVSISITSGTAIVQRDDAQNSVYDYRLAHSAYTTPVTGRRGANTVTITRPEPSATRLWLWPDRPIRLHQQFDAAGRTTLYRIDFATLPHRQDPNFYQTDLYLDMFISADAQEYAILDEDELEQAHQQGLISDEQHMLVLRQADELVNLLEHQQFEGWLASWCNTPFSLGPLRSTPHWQYRKYAPDEPSGWPTGVA